jgi:hemoglobin
MSPLMPSASSSASAADAEAEAAILECVRNFYGEAQRDALLGPIFAAHVHDWETHYQTVANFWSKVLLGTDRYNGMPFPLHVKLPVESEHFDRWLTLFGEAAQRDLPPDLAAKAKSKAAMMAASFKAGIFPFLDAQGRPSRLPV